MSTVTSPIQDAASLLRSTLISSLTTSVSQSRVPFTFTSTARLVKAGELQFNGDRGFAAVARANRTRTQLAIIEREARGTAGLSQVGLGAFVNAADLTFQSVANKGILGTRARLAVQEPVIRMMVNPESLQFSQSKRISRRDTMQGSTFYHFTNKANQNNDILEVSMSGQTGNIRTNVDPLSLVSTGAYQKLRVWHDLYALTREGMVLDPENTGNPKIGNSIPNQFYITYRTVLFPVQVTLVGFFSKVLEFTENASNPFSTGYSLQFTVTDTYPRLEDVGSQIASAILLSNAVDAAKGGINTLASAAESAASGNAGAATTFIPDLG